MSQLQIAWTDGELRVSHREVEGARLRTASLLRLTGVEGARDLPIQRVEERPGSGLRLLGSAHGFRAQAEWAPRQGERCDYCDITLTLTYTGDQPLDAGVQVTLDLVGPGKPTWLIPGAFYKENRLPQNRRLYPRWDFEGGDPQQLVSDAWSFRADRSALPAVFAWNEQLCGALCTEEMSDLGLTGVGFIGNAGGTSIHLTFPYREEPIVFYQPGQASPPDCPLYRWAPGQTVTLRFKVYVAPGDLHAYDPFVRQMYDLHREQYPLNPWMSARRAAELTAWGLYRWHFDRDRQILLETHAFDREANGNVQYKMNRPNMHVAWVSGAPYAYGLLTFGHRHAVRDYVDSASVVLDFIASGVSPSGLFWGEWREGRGWSQGWTPQKYWLQARTLAEATLYFVRTLSFLREEGQPAPEAWTQAALSNLDYIVAHQREDGNFGSYYHAETGEVMEWEGAGGILWIAALCEAAGYFNRPEYLAAAQRAGQYYRRFVEDEFIYGAPEDVHLTPTSEDGYNAVVAYVLLYESDPAPQQWLELARRSADWTMTHRWSYNLAWPEHSILAQYNFCSRGADHASPSNMHLHNYGLFCLPEMLRLWRYTKDDYYLNRTRDNLACFTQFIARADGDFNAYKGMVTERYYNTNCFQPKGMLLTLSHAWSVGVILNAAQAAVAFEEAFGVSMELPGD